MYYVCPRDMIVNKIDKVPILMMLSCLERKQAVKCIVTNKQKFCGC